MFEIELSCKGYAKDRCNWTPNDEPERRLSLISLGSAALIRALFV